MVKGTFTDLDHFDEAVLAPWIQYNHKKAIKNYMPMQDGDVVRTYADVTGLEKSID